MRLLGARRIWCVAIACGISAPTNAEVEQQNAVPAVLASPASGDVISASDLSGELARILGTADGFRQVGRNRAALEVVNGAAALATSDASKAKLSLQRGAALFGLGRFDEAGEAFDAAEALQGELTNEERVALLIQQGNLAAERRAYDDAFARYEAAATLANTTRLPPLEARARLNYARARIDGGYIPELAKHLQAAQAAIAPLPASDDQARLYLTLGQLVRRAIVELKQPTAWQTLAYDAFEQGLARAENPDTLGYGNGFLGELYEANGRNDDALTLTRRAIFYAQQAGADEQSYLWEWQLGRLLLAQGNRGEAEAALARSVELLDEVKSNFVLGSRITFDARVAPVYVQYADLLLARSATESDPTAKRATLRSVRKVLETFKRAEVEDYFGSSCVGRGSTAGDATVADAGAAVVYPVLLRDRMELLVETSGDLAQFTVPVTRDLLTRTARRLRRNLERLNAGDAYLEEAQTLHRWLIAPIEAHLVAKGVKTLVLVPDGPLRTIPPAVLHDGKQFLVARYAIALTPALELTENLARPAVSSVLIGGLTQSVRGFAPLPSVGREIDTVGAIYPSSRTMRDEGFRLDTVSSELQVGDYSVAHFATHGEFSSDYRRSFILTYDDQLTLNNLRSLLEQRTAEKNLDLLVLSACKTAAGDDRAALGLAGVAVQSGAQSALASLWYVSDAASAELIDQFYLRLHSGTLSKAESLREAQLALIADERFSHPSFWAPYLLIGNWL